jgi:hypothetical protein
MPEWFLKVLTSDFLWGIVVGLLISMIGAFVQAKIYADRLVIQQRSTVILFAQDVIKNIIRVAEDIEEARRRSRVIHHDCWL